jgi:hypothetical protein
LGASFAAALGIKITSLFLVIGAPAIGFALWRKKRAVLEPLVSAFTSFLIFYAAIWEAHFYLAYTVNPALEDDGYFLAAPSVRKVLDAGEGGRLVNLPLMMRAAYNYSMQYHHGVPQLNLCRDDESGSPPYFWPFGARSVQYRYEVTSDGAYTRYIYLQANPAAWLCSLVGVLGGAAALYAMVFLGAWGKLRRAGPLTVFFVLYAGYMAGVMRIDRAMYLYHYLVPLIVGMILFGLVLDEVSWIGPWRVSLKQKTMALRCALAAVLGCFMYFSPLAYFQPLTEKEVAARAWIPLWDLHCGWCPRTKVLAYPEDSDESAATQCVEQESSDEACSDWRRFLPGASCG